MQKLQKITIEKYNEIMSQIIAKNIDIDKTLIEMLDEARKYTIKDNHADNNRKHYRRRKS